MVSLYYGSAHSLYSLFFNINDSTKVILRKIMNMSFYVRKSNSIINLNNIIDEVCTGDLTGLVKNPDTDFTRRRKLPLDEFLKVTLNMQGGSIRKELLRCSELAMARLLIPSIWARMIRCLMTKLITPF